MDFLTVEQINRLMELPDDSKKGIRDRALLELMYATGIRAGEVINLEMADLNLRMGFITARENICVPGSYLLAAWQGTPWKSIFRSQGTICQVQAGRASPVRKLPRQQDHETGTVKILKEYARRQDLI